MHATDWDANASLISTISRSDASIAARASALRTAGTGPIPMTSGGTPGTAVATTRAGGARQEAAEAPPPKLASALGLHDEDGGRPVVDPGAVAGGHRPARDECR